jgi:hypothetical protein
MSFVTRELPVIMVTQRPIVDDFVAVSRQKAKSRSRLGNLDNLFDPEMERTR